MNSALNDITLLLSFYIQVYSWRCKHHQHSQPNANGTYIHDSGWRCRFETHITYGRNIWCLICVSCCMKVWLQELSLCYATLSYVSRAVKQMCNCLSIQLVLSLKSLPLQNCINTVWKHFWYILKRKPPACEAMMNTKKTRHSIRHRGQIYAFVGMALKMSFTSTRWILSTGWTHASGLPPHIWFTSSPVNVWHTYLK